MGGENFFYLVADFYEKLLNDSERFPDDTDA
jgi:hypothetical protein